MKKSICIFFLCFLSLSCFYHPRLRPNPNPLRKTAPTPVVITIKDSNEEGLANAKISLGLVKCKCEDCPDYTPTNHSCKCCDDLIVLTTSSNGVAEREIYGGIYSVSVEFQGRTKSFGSVSIVSGQVNQFTFKFSGVGDNDSL